jgi:hypothetical protein
MAPEKRLLSRLGETEWHWRDSQVDAPTCFPKERPAEPLVGSGWWDETSRCLCVWDGRQWVAVPLD